jgi:phosphatidylglycerol:prolipoprotein diacylglycerol transferase
MDPIIAEIGSFELAWHGLLMALGIITAVLLIRYLAKGVGISAETVYAFAVFVVIAGILGARLVHVLDRWDFYSDHVGQIFRFWDGGLAWYGGLIFGALAMIICARVMKVSLGRFADAGAPSVMLGLAVGRMGCTINGDIAGSSTSLPWGFIYTHPDSFPAQWGLLGVKIHPSPVYEIIWLLIVFGALWWLRGRLKPDGSLFLVMLAMYSFGRFLISWSRTGASELAILGPFHQAHIISLALFVGAVAFLIYRKVRWVKPELAEVATVEEPSSDA